MLLKDEFADRLRNERQRLGMSQSAFGKAGGVQANAQGKYESGERSPSADYLQAIAAIGVDLQFVLTGNRNASALTQDENQLLSLYRAMPNVTRGTVMRIVKALSEEG
ncbi:helix-turn-helix transcriptional regulator [Pseudomonas sp. Pc102]|uniref:helix-turn-helix domain-containing protein n=1 Tax=Pseudomonas sp. Pc102 TaxID=2678261 RepID=UPI001BD19FC8|nr:helix-turn-helix transcriptional regulator [Pseudomonas sp. Pc102]